MKQAPSPLILVTSRLTRVPPQSRGPRISLMLKPPNGLGPADNSASLNCVSMVQIAETTVPVLGSSVSRATSALSAHAEISTATHEARSFGMYPDTNVLLTRCLMRCRALLTQATPRDS